MIGTIGRLDSSRVTDAGPLDLLPGASDSDDDEGLRRGAERDAARSARERVTRVTRPKMPFPARAAAAAASARAAAKRGRQEASADSV